MDRGARVAAVRAFERERDCGVLLVSLKVCRHSSASCRCSAWLL
jgi:hypothetical protein